MFLQMKLLSCIIVINSVGYLTEIEKFPDCQARYANLLKLGGKSHEEFEISYKDQFHSNLDFDSWFDCALAEYRYSTVFADERSDNE